MLKGNEIIHLVQSRDTIEVHLPDGRTCSGPRGAKVGEFLEAIQPEGAVPIVGAIINGELRELTYKLEMDAHVAPVTMRQADGMRIYRRSLVFVLEAAFEELFPGVALTIDHSVSSGGYYCQVSERPNLKNQEQVQLLMKMNILIDDDIPIIREKVPLQEALDHFLLNNKLDKVDLLKHRTKDYLILYRLNEHRDYLHGYMVPSTGYLKWFDIRLTKSGFILCFPRRHQPTKIVHPPTDMKLFNTFRQYGDWLIRLGISNVGSLNDAVIDGRIREIILVAEALHEQQIAEIAKQIANRTDHIRIVTIAGPSSSGKTTTSKRLSIQLLTRGLTPFPLEMDRYFVNRDQTPRDENGAYDYESIDALDRPRLAADLRCLIAGDPVRLPNYSFKTGLQEDGEITELSPNQIIILEGLHGLNPELLPDIQAHQTYRIFVSALTQLNLDSHNRVSTTDTRLIRRIVRDSHARGYNAKETIQRWESVRRGEKRYVFPFQENADIMFNSALVYELAVLKSQAEPLLRQVQFGSQEYIETKRLLALLEWFLPMDNTFIPDNSILREFVGGSILEDFKIWKNHSFV